MYAEQNKLMIKIIIIILCEYFNFFILDFITEQAINTPDIPDVVPHVLGTLRGKRYTAPSRPKPTLDDDIEISLDLGEDVEIALNSASTDEIVDLAGMQLLIDLHYRLYSPCSGMLSFITVTWKYTRIYHVNLEKHPYLHHCSDKILHGTVVN